MRDIAMDNATATALKQSIDKWAAYSVETDMAKVQLGPKSCPLCALHRKRCADKFSEYSIDCSGCPVQQRTGKPGCLDTPYYIAERKRSSWHDWGTTSLPNPKYVPADPEGFRIAAKEEEMFLRSLLPEAV